MTHSASTTRLSYPFHVLNTDFAQNQFNSGENVLAATEGSTVNHSTKTSAKRLIFNFISGNSNHNNESTATKSHTQNSFKIQNLQLLQSASQQRRLSDYHRPLKVRLEKNFFAFLL